MLLMCYMKYHSYTNNAQGACPPATSVPKHHKILWLVERRAYPIWP
jgi:hypothetical protein